MSAAKLPILGLIILLIFGAGRIADIGKGLGQAIKNFKKGVEGEEQDQHKGASSKQDDRD